MERALLGSRVKLFMLRSLNRREKKGGKPERRRERDREKDKGVMGEEEEKGH